MKIKQSPEDFLVEELPLRKPSGKGDYTWFWLEKTNYTTTRALMQIARNLRVSRTRFGFSGNKDKYAQTKQVISAWKIEPQQLERIELKDINIKIIGKDEERICLGYHKGNKFDIVVRGLTKREVDLAKERVKLKDCIPDYFGPQRFSTSQNTHLIGKHLLKGELEGAAKEFLTGTADNELSKKYSNFAKKNWGSWKEIIKHCPDFLGLEKSVLNWLIRNPTDFAGALRTTPKPIRRLFIHAYQSWIFNIALSKYLESKTKCDKIKFLNTKLAFPRQKVDTSDSKFIIPGTKMRIRKDIFSQNLSELLKKDKLSSDDFRVKRMPKLASEGAIREPFIKISKLQLELLDKSNVTKNEKLDFSIKLKFDLGKGSYATVVLMALFKNEI